MVTKQTGGRRASRQEATPPRTPDVVVVEPVRGAGAQRVRSVNVKVKRFNLMMKPGGAKEVL